MNIAPDVYLNLLPVLLRQHVLPLQEIVCIRRTLILRTDEPDLQVCVPVLPCPEAGENADRQQYQHTGDGCGKYLFFRIHILSPFPALTFYP